MRYFDAGCKELYIWWKAISVVIGFAVLVTLLFVLGYEAFDSNSRLNEIVYLSIAWVLLGMPFVLGAFLEWTVRGGRKGDENRPL